MPLPVAPPPFSHREIYTPILNTSSTAPSPPEKEDSRLTPQYGTLCRMCGWAQKGELPTHGGMQRDPQIIYAY
eukprot:scaffold29732_cov152-Isochrysis_galbana.AAC.2